MMRRRLTWLLAVPLMVAGAQLAHALAYRLVTPDGHARAHELAESGHGYLAYAPAALGILSALAVVGLALQVLEVRRGLIGPRLAAAPFAFLPPLGFVFQEHLERLVHTGEFPLAAGLEPTFLVGLALQLPFALVAYALARALLAVADVVGGALARAAGRRHALRPELQVAPRGTDLPRIPVLAAGHAGRAPPARL